MDSSNEKIICIIETEQETLGLQATDPFSVPCFLFVRYRLQLPWPSLSPKGKIQTVANQRKKGVKTQRRRPPEAKSKKPEKLIRRGQIKGVQALHTPWYLLATLPWNHCYKTPQENLPVGTHSFRGMSLLCPPLPGKAINLFFSISPKTLSPRLDLAPVHRGWVFGIPLNFKILCSPIRIHMLSD